MAELALKENKPLMELLALRAMESITEPLEMSQMLWAMASLVFKHQAFACLLKGLSERDLSSQQLAGMAWARGKMLCELPG